MHIISLFRQYWQAKMGQDILTNNKRCLAKQLDKKIKYFQAPAVIQYLESLKVTPNTQDLLLAYTVAH